MPVTPPKRFAALFWGKWRERQSLVGQGSGAQPDGTQSKPGALEPLKARMNVIDGTV